MAAYVGMFIGAHHHCHGIPANIGVNLDLHIGIARIFGLKRSWNRVDVFGVGRVGKINTLFARLIDERFD